MQLGIRLHDTKKLPFEERIANVHELGFACGHLAPGKVISEFPTTDEALTPGLAMYMKMYSQKSGGCCGIRMLFEPGKPQPGAACENYPPLYGTYPFCFLAGLRCRGN